MGHHIRPFLKWAGSKFSCLNHVLSTFPPAERLIEPFTGSGAVFINTDFSHYLLAEDNEDLIALFYHLQQEGMLFIDECELLFCDENNCEQRYYHFRQLFNSCSEPRQRAMLFLYLNRHGYNGLCRYNQKRGYNVPFGRYEKPYFPRKEMLHFHQHSQRATFTHQDFRQTFNEAKPGDLIYCDPPYAPLEQNSNFSSYTHHKFGEQEQKILTELAMEQARRGITVIISNHDTAFTRHQYRYSVIKSFQVKRWIHFSPEKRTSVQELIAVFKPQ